MWKKTPLPPPSVGNCKVPNDTPLSIHRPAIGPWPTHRPLRGGAHPGRRSWCVVFRYVIEGYSSQLTRFSDIQTQSNPPLQGKLTPYHCFMTQTQQVWPANLPKSSQNTSGEITFSRSKNSILAPQSWPMARIRHLGRGQLPRGRGCINFKIENTVNCVGHICEVPI